MELLLYAIKFAALVSLTLLGTALMNYFMSKRDFKVHPHATYLIMPLVVTTLYLVGGFSMWTVKGIVMALILLYASVQDISTHEADDFLCVMLLILALVNFDKANIWFTVIGGLVVFIPQTLIAMFSKKGGVGGADIKISTAAALSLSFYGGVLGYMIGLSLSVVGQFVYNKVKKKSNDEPFALIPYISTGLMIGYFI